MRIRPFRPPLLFAGFLLPLAPRAAESRMEKTLRLGPGRRFSLDTDLGSVTVTGTTAADARVVVTSKRQELDELLRFNFREDPGSVSITARRKHGRFFGWVRSGESVHWEIQVPDRTQIDIDTSGGAIRTAGVRGDAKLETSGGAIAARDHVGDVQGHTSGGGIELARIRGTIRVETSGGGIEGTELDCSMGGDTSG